MTNLAVAEFGCFESPAISTVWRRHMPCFSLRPFMKGWCEMRFYFWLFKVFLGTVLGTVLGLLLGIVAHGFLVDWAKAATYNVLFNNVEQGAHSTSSPSVTVSGGQAKKDAGVSAEETAQAPAAPVIDVPQTAVPPVGTQVAQISAPSLEEWHSLPFRLELSGHVLRSEWASNDTTPGAGASVSYFPISDFGVSVLAGSIASGHYYWGGELEAIPLRLSLFGLKNMAEIGVLAGGTNLGAYEGVGATGHLGARASLNFGDRMGVSFAVRTNVTDRNRYSYVMAETGLTVRF